jgi:hypothetical protein
MSVWINPKGRFDISKPVFHHAAEHAVVTLKLSRVIRARWESVLEKVGWTRSNWVEAARRRSEGPNLDASV